MNAVSAYASVSTAGASSTRATSTQATSTQATSTQATSTQATSTLAAASRHTATPAQRARVEKTAQSFEASFLSSMFGQMFEGTELSEPFGGGAGESAFRSFMTDAMGKSMASHGGIGLARSVTAEMLKMQGLS